MIFKILAVGCGGFIGAVLRFISGHFIQRHFINSVIPLSTLSVNIFGCFLIGFLGEILTAKFHGSIELKLFIITGVLGGFTTYSAFSLEAISLFSKNSSLALFYVALHIFFGLGSAALGLKVASLFLK